MKKSLLNYKSLHFAIFLLLLCANISVAQRTIIHETFGSANIADPYTGGTSTSPAAITYTKVTSATTSAAVSVATANGDGYLSFTLASPATTTGRTYLTAPIPCGNFVQVLKDNPYPLTWTFNMRYNGSSKIPGLTTNPTNSYAPTEVLVASSSDLLSETTKGYAVCISAGSATGQQKIELNSFTGGLGFAGTTAVPPVSIISSSDFPASNYVSVKVTYTPSTDTWSLAVKDSGAGPFTNPATDTYPTAQTAVNNVNTSATMTHFGYFYCHKESPVSNKIFRTDNYKLVLESPFVTLPALPTVEKRQAFNSITLPTVSNLAATGDIGATIKWYDVPSCGLPLSSSTSLDYKSYYVSQTVNGVESDRVVSEVFVGDTAMKTLPFHEDFANYKTNDQLILINNDTLSGTGLGSWSVNAEATTPLSPDDVLIAAQPSSWTSSVLPTPTGKAITFDKSGLDPQILFDAPTSGSVYASCLFMVTNLLSDSNNTSITAGTSGTSTSTPKAPGQFFSLGYSAGAGQNTAYTAAVYLKTSTVDATKFNIGINASPATTILADDIIWDATDYSVNTPITLVTSYSYDDKISKLWINPTDNSTEPTANAATLPRSAALAVDRVRLTQQSSATTPFITLDEIRVANNWGEALGASSTLGITPVISSGFKMYPNPVSNGKLYIASTTNLEKEVAIYNTLGQEVLQSKTNNQAINVSNLSKGTYFVKITEAGITATKKLIIQ